MNRLRALAPLLVLALLGCATGSVQSDWDPEADFSTLKTYAWFPRTRPAAPDPRLNSTLLDARIQQAVEAELAAKGYTKNTVPHNADFLVAHSVAIHQAISATSLDDFYGPSYRRASRVYVEDYDVGTLVIDVLDQKKSQVIWRGSYQARITPATNPSEREERVRSAVQAVMEGFPPPATPAP